MKSRPLYKVCVAPQVPLLWPFTDASEDRKSGTRRCRLANCKECSGKDMVSSKQVEILRMLGQGENWLWRRQMNSWSSLRHGGLSIPINTYLFTHGISA